MGSVVKFARQGFSRKEKSKLHWAAIVAKQRGRVAMLEWVLSHFRFGTHIRLLCPLFRLVLHREKEHLARIRLFHRREIRRTGGKTLSTAGKNGVRNECNL